MQTTGYESIKTTGSIQEHVNDFVVVEAPLQININNEPYTVVMRTPNSDTELIRGLLYAEDIYKKASPFYIEKIKEDKDQATVLNCAIDAADLGKGYLNKRTLLSVSSCGICGKKELKDIQLTGNHLTNSSPISNSDVQQMQEQMQLHQVVFKQSGGSHAAAIFNADQKLLTVQEDIGRHNAVDKCIGDLLQKNQLAQANYLMVSGRVSYEIISKAFFAKIPVVVAVSACSSLAIDYAKEFGICLIGFSRGSKMTIYANPQYIAL